MEGMPMFVVAARWFDNWVLFVSSNERIQKERRHPGPITNF